MRKKLREIQKERQSKTIQSVSRSVVTVDYQKYAHFLENSDLSGEQKQEYLQTVWSIMVEFVSLGFNLHPLQQVKEVCGEDSENENSSSVLTQDMLNSFNQQISNDFNDQVEPDAKRQEEGVG